MAVPSATTNDSTVEPGEVRPDGVATEPEARGVRPLEDGSTNLGLLANTARDSLDGGRDLGAEVASRR